MSEHCRFFVMEADSRLDLGSRSSPCWEVGGAGSCGAQVHPRTDLVCVGGDAARGSSGLGGRVRLLGAGKPLEEK